MKISLIYCNGFYHVFIQGCARWARCLCGDIGRTYNFSRYEPYYKKVYVSGNHFVVYFSKYYRTRSDPYSEPFMEFLISRDVGASEKPDYTDYYFGESDENRRVI